MSEFIRSDITVIIIISVALLASLFTFIVAWRYRGGLVPVGWRAFVAMGLGSISVAAFYVSILQHQPSSITIPFSRILWIFVMLVTMLIAIGVLLLSNGHGE